MGRLAATGLDVADDHRPAGRRALGGLESKRAKLGRQPVRGPLAIRKMRWNGGNRRDRQKGEQPLERRRLAGVYRTKNVVNRSHVRSAPCRPFSALTGALLLAQCPNFVVGRGAGEEALRPFFGGWRLILANNKG